MSNAGMRVVNNIEVTFFIHHGYWHLIAKGARSKFDMALYSLAEALEAFTNP